MHLRRMMLLSCGMLAAAAGLAPFGCQASPTIPSGPPLSSDQGFMATILYECMLQVALGHLASQRGSGATLSFASQMVAAHEMWTRELRILAVSRGVSLPNALTDEQRSVLERLRAIPAWGFDDAYGQVVAVAHHRLVQMFETHLAEAGESELKTWMRRVLLALRDHLAQARLLSFAS